jgi:hypothetical protein
LLNSESRTTSDCPCTLRMAPGSVSSCKKLTPAQEKHSPGSAHAFGGSGAILADDESAVSQQRLGQRTSSKGCGDRRFVAPWLLGAFTVPCT